MKAQASLEALVAIAAYFAVIALFLGLLNSLAPLAVDAGIRAKAFNAAENGCLIFDYATLDGKGTEMRIESGGYVTSGTRELGVAFSYRNGSNGVAQTKCIFEVGKSEGIAVAPGYREAN
ncbi:TPA: hypothetical protein HA318_04665 [Candidatus Micrarchaeota archaeon]|nr:MAG: hypothetical protein AUJ65_05935 [Candidatus Micrarchaeota archaeon CG1_02_51_15]HII39265.1 hypothetical protein [Candidatus Micrarchaeota archaeon]